MFFKIGNQDGIFLVFFEEGDAVQPYWYGSVVEYSRTFEQLRSCTMVSRSPR